MWRDGQKLGRVYQAWNYYWRWFVWTFPIEQGQADTKEEAMAMVEALVNPEAPSCSCMPVPRSLAGLQRSQARRAAGGELFR
ncbi:MAG: hypothetical protein AAF739_03105 [Pseudomonadota bacterium]